MSHRAISIIECDHVSEEGQRCHVHLLVNTSAYDKDQVKARVSRRMLVDDKSPWQLGIVGVIADVPMQHLDFCPEHHVETEAAYDGGKPRYDISKIPNPKKEPK